MSRYIDADKIQDYLNSWIKILKQNVRKDNPVTVTLETICKDIEKTPTADVAPVVHAKWRMRYIPKPKLFIRYICSNCCNGNNCSPSAYCPNCGAKMEVGNE